MKKGRWPFFLFLDRMLTTIALAKIRQTYHFELTARYGRDKRPSTTLRPTGLVPEMNRFFPALAAFAILASPITVLAQSDTTEAPAAEASTAGTAGTGKDLPGQLSMGQAENTDGVGSTYVKEKSGDWTVQCIRAPEGQTDPCEMVQLLKEANGNPVVEMRIFALPAGGQAIAGSTVITPLETLLTEPLRLVIDGSAAKRYPYSWCSRMGCISRIGFSAADVDQLKRGAKGTMTIVPAAAQDQKVDLNMSLTGFTAAWNMLSAPAQ